MIFHFEPQPEGHHPYDTFDCTPGGAGATGMPSPLYFWEQIRILAEEKCDALRDSFHRVETDVAAPVEASLEMPALGAITHFHGSPLDAA